MVSDKGLESAMGFFGLTAGHTDDGDDEAGLTCMISNSRIPDDYEPGRFHLFGVGAYITIKPKIASIFNGLSKHGGTPPIAPNGVTPSEDAIRLVIVLYPPKAILVKVKTERCCGMRTTFSESSLVYDRDILGKETVVILSNRLGNIPVDSSLIYNTIM